MVLNFHVIHEIVDMRAQGDVGPGEVPTLANARPRGRPQRVSSTTEFVAHTTPRPASRPCPMNRNKCRHHCIVSDLGYLRRFAAHPIASRSPAGVVQRLEPQPSKLMMRVRFPPPAPKKFRSDFRSVVLPLTGFSPAVGPMTIVVSTFPSARTHLFGCRATILR